MSIIVRKLIILNIVVWWLAPLNPDQEVMGLIPTGGYTTVSCSAQLSLKLKVLINTEIAEINWNFGFRSTKPVIYHAYKC